MAPALAESQRCTGWKQQTLLILIICRRLSDGTAQVAAGATAGAGFPARDCHAVVTHSDWHALIAMADYSLMLSSLVYVSAFAYNNV